MNSTQKAIWALRIGVAGEFLGHGILAIHGKADWIKWTEQLSGMDTGMATKFILIVGIVDVLVALVVLFKPIKPVVLWAIFWGFWTALVRPLVGMPVWDFVERFANWGAPLALLFLAFPYKKE
jgi:hypothetical protein